jgi:outer membrane receptor protein involved in Fe transport
MFTNNKLAKSVRLAIAFGAAATALPASYAFAEEGEAIEKIEVTGSRIKRTDLETSSPVQITSAEDIKLSGFTKIEDLLNSLPQIEAAETSFQSNGASGTATLDLRGMGSNRTLVLINGRRLQPGGIYSQSPDVNQIPAALVKRVEVMTGGGSSVYGADAVAGVVNFVMNDDFEGFEITAGVSGYQHNNSNDYIQGLMDAKGFDYPEGQSGLEGKTYNIDLTMGGDFADGKGHAVVYANYRDIEELRQSARDYSSCALNQAGDTCGGSGNAIIPNFYVAPIVDGDFDWGNYSYLTLNQNSDFIASSGNQYNYAPVNHFMRPDEKYSLGAMIDYELNDTTSAYMEVAYMHDLTRAQIAESGTFFAENYIFTPDNPAFSAAQTQQLMDALGVAADDEIGIYIGKRNVEGGPRSNILEHNSFRMVTGVEGELNDTWTYDVSFQYASTASASTYINDFFAPRIATAVNPELCAADSACIDYEVFKYQGVTAESAAALTGTAVLTGVTSERILNGFVSGEFDVTLPTADTPIAAVFGFESRELDFERIADEVYAQGQLLGQGGPTKSLVGGYSVQEVFTELSVPVLEGAPMAEMVTLDLGFRYSDYNTTGGESTYKVAVDWSLNSDWKVRAGYNRAVRAPNVAELFAEQSRGLWGGDDPCAVDLTDPTDKPAYSQAQCANTGMTAAQYGNVGISPAAQYNGLFGGNTELDPEIADTVTLGLVANPMDNLNFTIDYFDIQIEDVIGSVGAQLTVEKCAETGDAAFCDNVNRSSGGSLWVGTGFVQATNINLASRHWQGVDVSVNYEQDFLDGKIVGTLIGTSMLKKEYDPLPGVEGAAYDCAGTVSADCFAQPEWRHSAKVAYESGSFWTVSAIWRYFGEVEYTDDTDGLLIENGSKIDAQSYFDLKGAFTINDNMGVLVGVNNVLDEEPPMVGSTLSTNANTVAGYYDTLGRYIHASVTVKF